MSILLLFVQIVFSLSVFLVLCVYGTQLELVAVGMSEIATWLTFYWKSFSVMGS